MRARAGGATLIAVAAAFALLWPAAAPGHSGPNSAPTYRVPFVASAPDQVLVDWSSAATVPVQFSSASGPLNGTLYVQRDATNLYLQLVLVDGTYSGTSTPIPTAPTDTQGPDWLMAAFDDQDTGVLHDALLENVHVFTDSVFTGPSSVPDLTVGGTNDGSTTESWNPTTHQRIVYLQHPLCSGDLNDLCFSAAHPQAGITLGYRAGDGTTSYWPGGGSAPDANQTVHLLVDEQAPTNVQITAPAAGSLVGNGTSVTVHAEDNVGVTQVALEYSSDGGTTWSAPFETRSVSLGTSGDATFPLSGLPPDGDYLIRAKASDASGNSGVSPGVDLKVDSTPPTLTVTCNEAACDSGWYTTAGVTVIATATSDANGPATITYSINSSDVRTYGSAFNVGAGVSDVTVTATDAAGNSTSDSFVVHDDSTPPPTPHLTLTADPGHMFALHDDSATQQTLFYRPGTAGSLGLAADDNDPQSHVVSATFPSASDLAAALGGTWTVTPGALTDAISTDGHADGTGTFAVTTTNGAGMTDSTDLVLRVVPDATAPGLPTVLCDGVPCDGVARLGPVNVSFLAPDSGSGAQTFVYTTDGSDPSLTNGTTWNGLPVAVTATTTFRVLAIDGVGNVGGATTQSVPITSASSNLLGNGDFESATAALQQGTGIAGGSNAVHVSYGNWQPYAQEFNGTGYPMRVTAPLHGGAYAGEIRTSTSPAGGNGAHFDQDLPASFAPNQGFVLEGWIDPIAGESQMLLVFDSDRDAGVNVGTAGVTFTPTATSFGAWGMSSGGLPALSTGTFHHVKLVAYGSPSFTSALYVDGALAGTITTPGSAYALNPSFSLPASSLLIGADCGSCATFDDYVFDDMSVQQLSPPAAASTVAQAPSAAAAAVGTAVHDVATVTGAGTPTGSVAFTVCGPLASAAGCTSGAAALGSAALSGGAATSADFTPSAPGWWCFGAAYGGDSGNLAASDTGSDGCFQATAASGGATLPDIADASVSASNPDTNYGALDHLDSQGGYATSACDGTSTITGAQYAYLKFDLSSLPPGAHITSARVVLTSRSGFAWDGDPNQHLLYVADDGWSESDITYANAPAPRETYPGSDLGAAFIWYGYPSCGDFKDVRANTFTTSALAGQVQSKLAGDKLLSLEVFNPNCASCTVQPNGGYWVRFYSREASEPAYRPQLVVNYDVYQTGPTYTVNTTADTPDPCTLTQCSLRAAIDAANANPGADTIRFALEGPATITLASPLPQITDPVTISGPVTVDAAGGGGSAVLDVAAPDVTIQGLDIVNGAGYGIRVGGPGAIVRHNTIGVDASGAVPGPNAAGGIQLLSTNALVGGPSAGDGNWVAGNGGAQIGVVGGASGNAVEGNHVGGGPVPTVGPGISVNGSKNVIGSATAGDGNTIAGVGDGVVVAGGAGNVVEGNDIGTATLGNAKNGVLVEKGAAGTAVGVPGAGNSITGNGADGVSVVSGGKGTTIRGNTIGATLGDGPGNAGDGVHVDSVSNGIRIGGTGPGDGNEIDRNGGAGVAVASTGDAILGNSIHDNTGLGIALAPGGPLPNDPGDVDTGPNGLQNYPELAGAVLSGASLHVTGALDSVPLGTYRVELYGNGACDPSGYGQGQTFLGSADVTTDAGGHGVLDTTVTGVKSPGVVTATATDAGGNTSEFSACLAVSVGGTVSSITGVGLSPSTSTTPPGAVIVPEANVPPSAFVDTGTPPGSVDGAPFDSIPFDSIPFDSIAAQGTPFDSIPFDSIGLTSAGLLGNGLGGLPLSDIPLRAPNDWQTLLAPTPLAGRTLESTTLADVLALPASEQPAALTGANGTPRLTLADVDLSATPFDSIGIGALALGPLQLSSIPILGHTGSQNVADWCSVIAAAPGFRCDPLDSADLGTVSNETVMDIALQGVPFDSIPFDSIPFDSIDLTGTPFDSIPVVDTPFDSIPFDSIDIKGSPFDSIPFDSIDMSVSPFDSIPFDSILLPADGSRFRDLQLGSLDQATRDAIVTCGLCSGLTLGQAFDAGLLVPGATLHDLGHAIDGYTVGDIGATFPGVTLGNVGRGLPDTITVHDFLALLMNGHPREDWDTLPLAGIQRYASSGGLVTYTATFTLNGTGAPASATVAATLDPGAVYVPGSATLNGAGIVDPMLSGHTLTWNLDGVPLGTSSHLAFQVRPGLDLGGEAASVSVGAAGVAPVPSAPATVSVGDTFEPNDTPAGAQTLQPDALTLSYLSSGTDGDWYKLPVPAAGAVTDITLSHLQHDADLVVYGPGQQPLVSAPFDSIGIGQQPLVDQSATLQQSTQALVPQGLADVPFDSIALQNDVVVGSSDNADTANDQVTLPSAGEGGSYYVHVVNTAAVPFTEPYVLRAHVTPPPTLPQCQARVFTQAGTSQLAAPSPATAPASAKTLILVDDQRIGATYGATGETTVVSALQTLAARPDVAGIVVPVESDPTVASALAVWDQSPCSPALANGVVRAITSLVASYRNGRQLTSIVIVGGDDLGIPYARVLDQGSQVNERGFAANFGFTNNEYVGSLANSYMLTDDAYGDTNPTPFLGGQLYVPEIAVGRLVETPDDIAGQIAQFVNDNGRVSPQVALTAGYDFLADGSQAVADALHSFVPTSNTLISLPTDPTQWTHTDLVGGMFATPRPTIVVPNAHYDQYRLLPAANSATHNESTDIMTSAELLPPARPTDALVGTLAFTIGCHSGFTLADWLYPPGDPFALDWAEAYSRAGAIAYVGQTAYGLGDTEVVGYSEKLQWYFAQNLPYTTLGQALVFAKQRYFGELGVVTPYDLKVGNEATFYGLPMWRVGSATPPAPPAEPQTMTDVATGLPSVGFALSGTQLPYQLHTSDHGSWYSLNGDVQVTNRRPLEPRLVLDETVTGLPLHGALITGLTASTQAPFTAAFSRAVDDSSANTPPYGGDVSFPSAIQTVTRAITPLGTRDQVVLVLGQFRSASNPDEAALGQGAQTLYTSVQGKALYSTSSDFIPPTMSNVRVTSLGGQVAFSLDATDVADAAGDAGTVKDVEVLYLPQGEHVFHRIALANVGGDRWSGGGATSSDVVDYYVEVVDAAGNVGLSSHKSAPVTLQAPASSPEIDASFDATPGSGGWYGGAVAVTLHESDGSPMQTSLDGAPFTPYTSPVPVSGDGLHLLDVTALDGATATIPVPIDTVPPTATVAVPADGADFLAGDAFTVEYACADSGSGIAPNGCVGDLPDGAALPTGTAGTFTFHVRAADAAGHTATVTTTYSVWPWGGFQPPVNAGGTTVRNAGAALPVSFSLGGNRGTGIFAPGYPRSQPVSCTTQAPLGAAVPTASPGASGLSYAAGSKTYTYVWKTDRAWAGTCRVFTLQLPFGSARHFLVSFK